MTKVSNNNSIQTGYGKETAGGAAAGQEAKSSDRNKSSKNNAFKDPFEAISPANTTKFDFKKVTEHGRELSKNAQKRRDAQQNYAMNKDGSFDTWKDMDAKNAPDAHTAANKHNPLEEKAFNQKFSPESQSLAFQVKTDDSEQNKKDKASKSGEETIVASHNFDNKKKGTSGANKSSSQEPKIA